jgi:hypothetical protein
MAPSKQDTTILHTCPAKNSLHQRAVALHFRFGRELMTKKAKEINGCTRKGAS